MFTWRTWTTAWLGRMVLQVIFFALIGLLVGDADTVRFLVIGNAVMLAAVESMFVVASTTWERRAGTLPLLVASPTSPLLVFASRSLHWLVTGAVSASVSLFVAAAVFGIALPWPRVLLAPLLILAVGTSTYLFASFLGALILRAMEYRNVVGNVVHLSMMAICGVMVPVDFWPTAVQRVASLLPVTHGLGAVRALLDGAGPGPVLRGVAVELLVGVGWFVLALLSIRRLVDRGRTDGSIEYAA
jgi:ABC-2 type transport system permease protein